MDGPVGTALRKDPEDCAGLWLEPDATGQLGVTWGMLER
jgi:hypothetical protein